MECRKKRPLAIFCLACAFAIVLVGAHRRHAFRIATTQTTIGETKKRMAAFAVLIPMRADCDMKVGTRRSRSQMELDPNASCDDSGNNHGGSNMKRSRLVDLPEPCLGLADLPVEMRGAILLCLDRATDYAACVAASSLFRGACTPRAWVRCRALFYAKQPERVFASDECVAVVREVWTRWGVLSPARPDAHGHQCTQGGLWAPRCRCWEHRTVKDALDRGRRSTVAFLCDIVLDVHRRRARLHLLSNDQKCDGDERKHTTDDDDDDVGTASTDTSDDTATRRSDGTTCPRHRSIIKNLAYGALWSGRPGDGFYLLDLLARPIKCPFRAKRYVTKRAAKAILEASVDEALSIVRASPAETRKALLNEIVDDAVAFGDYGLALMAHKEGADDPFLALLCQIVRDVCMVDHFGRVWERAIAAGHEPNALWATIVDAVQFSVFADYPAALEAVLHNRPPGVDMGPFCARAVRDGGPSCITIMRALGVGDFHCPQVHDAIIDACDADRIDMVRYMVEEVSDMDPRLLLARTCPQRSPRVADFLARYVADLDADAERSPVLK
nr:hypothetical protein [Pandoravirus aubagnensis]